VNFLEFISAEMKQRSASLDHPAYGHRRHLQHRATVTIRTPYVTFFTYIKTSIYSIFLENLMKNLVYQVQ